MAGLISSSWQNMAAPPELLPKSLHLWRFPLDYEGPLPDFLNSDEKQRAQRLRIPEKAKAFVVGRTRLRQILSRYLEISPEDINFTYNEHGKPALAGQSSEDIAFNLSHSGSWGLCAVLRGGAVGVDVETVKTELDVIPLAGRFLSAAENSWLASVDPVRQRRSFYRLWTRKEAWLKGKGGGFSGLTLGLDDAHLSPLLSTAQGWTLMNMPIAKGYVGALAVEGEVYRVERFYFSG